MQLTNFTDYSLRVLMYLAAKGERLATISEVAEAYGISRNHLVKVVHNLALQGFISTLRGQGGGMRLARPPHLIVIGEVVRRTEPAFHLECFDPATNRCRIDPACNLRHILAGAYGAFLAALDGYTLADAVSDPSAVARLFSLVEPSVQE